MSVEELEARIAKLSVDIDLQKEVLRQLESQKSAAQRQLNAIRDPVARLPLEISSEIFLLCLPSGGPKPEPPAAPILLLNVCNAWTEIALSSPELWAAIRLDGPSQAVEVLQRWLQRARHSPLSISLRNSLNDGFADVLWQYAKQIKHLELYEEEHDAGSWPSLPCLQTLTIGSPLDDDAPQLNQLSLEHVMGLLHLAPNIVECNFHDISIHIPENTPDDLILPSLLSLKFEGGGDDSLHHLALPALEVLAVPLVHTSSDALSLFLRRSLPPLRRLVLGNRYAEIWSHQLGELLRLLPSLAELELHTSFFTDSLFSVFADFTSELLPNLRSLKIQNHSPEPFPLSHEVVLRALSARRPQLVCFHLRVSRADMLFLDETTSVVDRLRYLAVDGMELYIGDDQTNYVSL
ncbi:F-box domain-containing protein [Mycena venus]|uniref:F-box domain-containing protein n=1 Tax=Mycena venus TaxID=2733690 RepID=A0A8H7CHP8_9AGAR|nr:F-box domain-containing protein [Mycena venus]